MAMMKMNEKPPLELLLLAAPMINAVTTTLPSLVRAPRLARI